MTFRVYNLSVTVLTRPNRPIARYRALKRAIGRYRTLRRPIWP